MAVKIGKLLQKSVNCCKNQENAAKIGKMQQKSGNCSELNENDVDNRNFDCHAKTNPMMVGIFMSWSLLRNCTDSDHFYF